jgi:hypothetical protein
VVQIVRSNLKNIELRDLERLNDVIEREIYKRDIQLISEEFNSQFKRLDKVLDEKIKREIERKTKSFQSKK